MATFPIEYGETPRMKREPYSTTWMLVINIILRQRSQT